MSFKEFIESDISNVFMNCDEFAQQHDLNGTKCSAVIEKLTTKERAERQADNYGGIHGSFITVYVKTTDIPEIPIYGENFRLDDKLYFVDYCDNDMGMLTIRLAANDV